MIGRLYSSSINNQAQTTAKTLLEIAAAADLVVTLERMWITQSSFDTSENLGASVRDIATTGTGSANTPAPLIESTVAATATVKTNHTIEPTYGSTDWIFQGFNVLSGFLWTPGNDDEVIVVSPSQLAGMRLSVAPSGSMDFSYGLIFREIGG